MPSTITVRERLEKEWSKINNKMLWTTATESPEVLEWFLAFVESECSAAEVTAREEEHMFFLNILDGIDIADRQTGNKGGGTKAIRFSLQNRYTGPQPGDSKTLQ